MTRYCIQQDLFGRLLLARTQIIVKGKNTREYPQVFPTSPDLEVHAFPVNDDSNIQFALFLQI